MKLTLQIGIVIAIVLVASHLIGSGLAHSATKIQFCAEMLAMILLSCAFSCTLIHGAPLMNDKVVEN